MPSIPEGAPTFILPASSSEAQAYFAAEVAEGPLADEEARLLFGIKVILFALHTAAQAYNRHRGHAVTQLPGSLISVLDFLASIDDFMLLLNPPGPR